MDLRIDLKVLGNFLKKICGLTLCLVTSTAFADSSLQLYGVLDDGITYTNNVRTSSGASHELQFISGSTIGEHWGLTGSEDLGGDWKTVFKLESGFSSSNGAQAVTGSEFNRQAYVGVRSPVGEIDLGQQYDFIGQIFPFYSIGALTPAGLLGWSLHSDAAGGYSLDDRVWGENVGNAVSYSSPSVGGFKLNAMYGLGNVAGSLGTGATTNAVISYNVGDLSASLGYIAVHNNSEARHVNTREFVGGASYKIGNANIFGLVTHVEIGLDTTPSATTYEGGATYNLRPDILLGASYQLQTRNNGLASANQLTIVADYLLSKRTSTYIAATLARDHAFGAQAQAAYGSVSDSTEQTAVRVGLQHTF
ncbi:porin [Paraburkholderia sp. D1E]|uniref:porin n=1 Tax=Paraburkholderia sp. D1E TaxID=3461398 RepID=UPI004045BFD3